MIFLNLEKAKEASTEFELSVPEVRETESVPSLPMVDVTAESGINFVHESGRYGDKLLPETMGSGVAVLDFNNDGHQDLFFVNSSRWPWDRGKPAGNAVQTVRG